MLKDFIGKQTAFNKSVEEKLGKIDILACRGDDLWGAPRAGQYAGWRPRSPHGFRTRRPAPPEGPAAPAAGWRLRRGELEPGDEDKASQQLSGQK
jgi:cytochrome c5